MHTFPSESRIHRPSSPPLVWALAMAMLLALGGSAKASPGGDGADLPPKGAAPINDDFAQAIVISGLNHREWGDATNATAEAGEPAGGYTEAHSTVWYRWTAPERVNAIIDTCTGSANGRAVAVYTGDEFGALTRVADGAENCGYGTKVWFSATAGTTYHIAVDSAAGVFTLALTTSEPFANDAGAEPEVREAMIWPTLPDPASERPSAAVSLQAGVPSNAVPTNDNFADAELLTGSSGTRTGSTALATAEPNEQAHAGRAAARSVWYRWVAPATNSYDFSTCMGASLDTVLVAYAETTGTLTMVAANDDWCGNRSGIRLHATQGATYVIAVDGEAGSFVLEYLPVTSVPTNDDFENATVITGLAFEESTYNGNASAQFGEPAHSQVARRSLWYEWTPTAQALATVDACDGENFSRVVGAYQGDSLTELTPVLGQLTSCGNNSTMSFRAQAGVTYRFAVDGLTGSGGRFRFRLAAVNSPANDDFANAVELTGTSGNATGNNRGATAESGELAHMGPARASMWYRWVAPSTGPYDFSTCTSTNFNTVMAAYTRPADSLVVVNANDNWCSTQSSIRINATAGTDYWIVVDGADGRRGDFRLEYRSVGAVPPNDDFENATRIVGMAFEESTYNTNASAQFGEPANVGVARRTIWYRWTAPERAYVVADACSGENFPRNVRAYRGETLTGLTRIDDYTLVCPNSSAIGFVAEADITYQISIDGDNGLSGAFRFRLQATPPAANDDIANAIEISEASGSVTGSNRLATAEPGEPDHLTPAVASLWYRWVAPQTGAYDFSTCTDTNFSTMLAVYTGSSGELAKVAANGAYCGSQSQVRLNAVGGTTYWIAVDSRQGNRGEFRLSYRSVTSVPINDDFENATVITGTSYSSNANSLNGSAQLGEPTHRDNPPRNSLWYRWTAPLDSIVTVRTCGTGSRANVIAVYTGESLASLTSVAVGSVTCTQARETTFAAARAVTYHIAVDNTSDSSAGPFPITLNASLGAGNNNIVGYYYLVGTEGSTNGSTVGASAQTGEPAHAGLAAKRSVWYLWIAPETALFDFDTCEAPAFDTVLAAYTGNSNNLSSMTRVAADRGWCGAGSSIRINAVAGTEYWIAVDTTTIDRSGAFRLRYRPAGIVPPNDNFQDAILLTGLIAESSGNNHNASAEFGEPSGYQYAKRTVWYRWMAPASARVVIDTCEGGPQQRMLAVFRGDSFATTTRITTAFANCGPGASAEFPAVEGTTYHIAVDSWLDATTTFTLALEVKPPPPHDNIGDAQELLGTSGVAEGTNTYATAEQGEPRHGADPPNRSLWYRWIAPEAGIYEFSTCDYATFDTVMAVYTGTPGALAQVRSNNDWCASGSLVRLTASQGAEYWIAVDGISNGGGTFRLHYRPVLSAPPNDDFEQALVFEGPSFLHQGTNVNASGQPGESSRYGIARRTVWYRWTAPSANRVRLNICEGDQFGRSLSVFRGSVLSSLTHVVSERANCGSGASVEFLPGAETTYHFAVDGWDGASGAFVLEFDTYLPPANDNIADAQDLVGERGSVEGNTISATEESPEPRHPNYIPKRTVWFRWVAPRTGTYYFSTCSGALFDTVLAAYTGDQGSLTPVVADDDYCGYQSRIAIPAIEGSTYWIALGSYPHIVAEGGPFTLSYFPAGAPANDHYSNATLLEGESGQLTASSVDSVVEPISPSAGSDWRRSVWFRWVAPENGAYQFDTCNSPSIRTYFRLATPNGIGAPAHVRFSSDRCGSGAMLTVNATAGTEYLIEVLTAWDAYFELSWRRIPQSTNPLMIMGQGELMAAALSPDTRYIVTAGSAGTYLREVSTGRLVRHLREAGDWVVGVAYSPDGTLVATGSYDNRVKLWDIATGRLIRRFAGHTGYVENVVFSPDGTRILSGSQDKTARVFDRETGTELLRLAGHTQTLSWVAYSADGSRIATASADGTAKVWDATTGALIFTLTGHTDVVRSVAFSPDGTRLVTTSHDTTVRTWNMADGSLIRTMTGHRSATLIAVYTPNADRILSGSVDQRIIVWNPETGEIVDEITDHTNSVIDIEFSRDGTKLFTASRDLTARLWNWETKAELRRVSGHTSLINVITVSPDGSHIASGSEDGKARIWDSATGLATATLTGHFSQILDARYSPEGTHLFTGSADGTARLWDLSNSLQIAQHHESSYNPQAETLYDIRAVDFSPDGRRLLTGGGNRVTMVRSRETGQVLERRWSSQPINSARYKPDGTDFYTLGTGFRSLEFTPDESQYTAATGNAVNLYRTYDRALVRSFTGHTAMVSAATSSPDGSMLATASADSTARLYDFQTARTRMFIQGHAGYPISSVAFSKDNRHVYTGGRDGTILKWDVRPSDRDQDKLLLIAGGDPASADAADVVRLAEYARTVHSLRGILDDRVHYLSAHSTGEPALPSSREATLAALRDFTTDARSLTVMLIGPTATTAGGFPLNATEQLGAEELATILNELQSGNDPLRHITVYTDAGGGGSFVRAIGARTGETTRVLVAASDGDQPAPIVTARRARFSTYFFAAALAGRTVDEAFVRARDAIRAYIPGATPILLNSTSSEARFAKTTITIDDQYLGRPDSLIEIVPPTILATSPDQTVAADAQVTVWAEVDGDPERVIVTLTDGVSTFDYPMADAGERWQAIIPLESRWKMERLSLIFEASRPESDLSDLAVVSAPVASALYVVPDPPVYTGLPSRWYFAEGVTYPGFESYVLLHNPNDTTITVTLEMLFENEPATSLDLEVGVKSRRTIGLNRLVENRAMAIVLTERQGRGFAADRAVYTSADGRWVGAHAAIGTAELHEQFYFAEGASSPSNGHGDEFQTFILLANPGTTPVEAIVTYYPEPGLPIEELVRLDARSRRTLEPGRHHPGLARRGFATKVQTRHGGRLVAERAMWWRDSRWNPGVFVGGSAAAGAPAPSREHHFAEVGQPGQREFLLLLNPHGTLATFELAMQLGDRRTVETHTIAPRSRRTMELPAAIAAAPHGIHLTADLPLVAERSTYRDLPTISPAEGDSSGGASRPARTWLFAEGANFDGFETTFVLANPGTEEVRAWFNFHREGAAPVAELITVAAGRSTTLRSAQVEALNSTAFSTEVISTAPIMVERTIVFGPDGMGGTTSAGIALPEFTTEPFATEPLPGAGSAAAESSTELLPTPTPTPTPTATPILPPQ